MGGIIDIKRAVSHFLKAVNAAEEPSTSVIKRQRVCNTMLPNKASSGKAGADRQSKIICRSIGIVFPTMEVLSICSCLG